MLPLQPRGNSFEQRLNMRCPGRRRRKAIAVKGKSNPLVYEEKSLSGEQSNLEVQLEEVRFKVACLLSSGLERTGGERIRVRGRLNKRRLGPR